MRREVRWHRDTQARPMFSLGRAFFVGRNALYSIIEVVMLIYILLMMLPFYIPMLFPNFVRRHFDNEIRMVFGGMTYFVPYMILIQWFPQGDDLLKLYFLQMVSFFLGLWHGKTFRPWAFKDAIKMIFSGSGIILILLYLLLSWVLTHLDIDDYGRYFGVVALTLTSGSQMGSTYS